MRSALSSQPHPATPALGHRSRAAFAALAVVLAIVVGVLATGPADAKKKDPNPATPGSFTGYGFDQCIAPTQAAMNKWTTDSPYFAIGIYISGDSRACINQPNLTTTWVSTQLAAGWHLLPITLGPQASCTTVPRYLHQVRINPSTATTYYAARVQGAKEADKAVAAAQALGIVPGSTLFYDLEAFNIKKSTACTQSARYFLQAWTNRLHQAKYVSGAYSSAASGIKMLDDARATAGNTFVMPDQVWIADWNGRADANSTYVRSDGWSPHARAHQYQGGHNETYGGVTINIDKNWVDLGKGLVRAPEGQHCGGVPIDFTTYAQLQIHTTQGAQVQALKCLLSEKKLFGGKVRSGTYGPVLLKALKAWQAAHGRPVSNIWTTNDWVSLLSDGAQPVLKYGSSSEASWRLQRTLVAAGQSVPIKGIVNTPTINAVAAYQARVKLPKTGIMAPTTWAAMAKGLR
jgi:peptidoglycan hydrolase-like protein with peptidoglycan-binding domain